MGDGGAIGERQEPRGRMSQTAQTFTLQNHASATAGPHHQCDGGLRDAVHRASRASLPLRKTHAQETGVAPAKTAKRRRSSHTTRTSALQKCKRCSDQQDAGLKAGATRNEIVATRATRLWEWAQQATPLRKRLGLKSEHGAPAHKANVPQIKRGGLIRF